MLKHSQGLRLALKEIDAFPVCRTCNRELFDERSADPLREIDRQLLFLLVVWPSPEQWRRKLPSPGSTLAGCGKLPAPSP